MNRSWNLTSLALIALALPCGTARSAAQPPAPDLVPFKVSWMGAPAPGSGPSSIATDPAIVSLPSVVTGQSDLFGPFTGAALATQHLGVDGKPLYSTVVAEWTMASGDALSIELSAIVYLPQPTPGGPTSEGAFVITNGKGRFLGARGSGFLRQVLQIDPVTHQVTGALLSAEGFITRPR